ncbi:MAG: transposase [Nitrososphaera sp.]
MAIVTAVKCINQACSLSEGMLAMMETFRQMVNDCLRIGLENNASTLKRLSKLCYPALAKYDIISYYKLNAISKAAGILSNRKQSIKRGYPTRTPYMKRALLISSYGFKVENGVLQVPLGDRRYFDILLNSYVKCILSDAAVIVRSFTLAANNTVSIAYSKEVTEIGCNTTAGVDRNLANVAYGNHDRVVMFDVSQAVRVAENTRSITRSFRRNDVRIRKMVTDKYGRRRRNRVSQLLHKVSKAIVQDAKERKAAIVFEDITFIRKLYQKGNYQGREYRGRMNSWSFFELKRQVEYKAAWEGVKVITLTKSKTRGTSQLCPRCGKRVQEAERDNPFYRRQLWCQDCRKWMDRDVVAAMNIARRGADVFQRPEGLAGEAMVQELGSVTPVILKVDASKLTLSREPIS